MTRVTLDGDTLRVNIADLLKSLPAESLPALVDELAIDDAVIEQVANQIADGWTDMDSHAWHDEDSAEPRSALGKARRKCALAAGGLAAEQIAALAAKLEAAEATIAQVKALADGRATRFEFRDEALYAALTPP